MAASRFPWNALVRARSLALLVAFVVAGPLSARAEDAPRGRVVYVEGTRFTVARAGAVRSFAADDDSALGFPVQDGDLVQTLSGTFVEIQLLPGGTVLKIAENSSFLLSDLGGDDGAVSLGLVYGRVRAKVAKLAGAERFSVRSGSTVAGVRGTDFGFDSIARRSSSAADSVSSPDVRVYCFSGEISVAPDVPAGKTAEAALSVVVKADEMLSVRKPSAAGEPALVERATVALDVKEFWAANEFRGPTPVSAPASAPLVGAAPAAAPAEPLPAAAAAAAPAAAPASFAEELAAASAAIRLKNRLSGAAAVLGIAGAGLQAAAFAAGPLNMNVAPEGLMAAGGACFAASLVAVVASLVVNPPAP